MIQTDKKNSLLIVDDDTSILMELTHILQPDYKIYTAKDGLSALNRAEKSMPDLILLDVVMPDMSGFEVFTNLGASDIVKNIPVIFMTGINDESSESEGLAIGAVDYIRKPFDTMVVKHRVHHQVKIINLQRDLEKAAKAAEMASQTKSAFLAHMSHEIRTPMNAILGVTEILIQNETLPAEIGEGLEKIYSSCDLLLGIINDILDFSKIEAGKLDIITAQYKIASLINDSVHLNMMRINSKPIEFELQIEENIPATLIGDELRIKQILNNLLSNAFKYTDTGKVVLSVKFECLQKQSQKDQIMLMLCVRDTGHGMSKEQLTRMYDEYSRFHQKAKKTVEGTGLGLAIAQRLINLMGGEMQVESEPGKGSYFVVKIPQVKVGSEVLGSDVAANLRQFRLNYIKQKKRGQITRDPMPYGNILVVDDVETNLYVATGLLKLYRLKIDTAMSGLEAIEKIKEGNVYDAIFMDHMMPEMDGIETTKNLRDMGYTEPIVALTANAVAGQADIFLQNGFDEFISKPIDIRQLNVILNKLVRDKQPPDVIEKARKLNVDTAAKTDGNSPQMDLLLLESFIRDARKAAVWLEDMIIVNKFKNIENNNDDLRKFTVIVHGMKSSLLHVGETQLSETAQKLEASGREQNIEFIKASAHGFFVELCTLLEKLESKQNEMQGAQEDPEDLLVKLKAIQDMCADYDRKGALDILAEIKNCSKKTKAVLDNITEYVMHSEFEEAENTAVGYAETLTADQPGSRLLNKKIAGLDIIKGLERYDNDETVYIKILRSYKNSLSNMLGEIENVSEETLKNYKIKVHGIKGTSLDIFAEELGISASALEKAAGSGDLDYILNHNPAFLENGWKIAGDIDELLSALDAENPKPVKDKPDNEVLVQLLSACRNYDMDGADAAIFEIEKYQYESDEGLALWLRDNIDMMNFKRIVEKLEYLDKKGD
jgi:signal transduction histidine kinase/HPt (histidine-containing phosphotransfer) domain-containing protein